MRKPGLTLDIESKIDKLKVDSVTKKRKQLLNYVLTVLDERKEIDVMAVSCSADYEPVENYSIEIYTIRVNGKIVIQEFPCGSSEYGVWKRYKLFI